jgi:hypothetical protein
MFEKAMLATADGQLTNKVAAHWAQKLANRKAQRYAFLDSGATSRAALEEDKQDLNNTGEISKNTFMFPNRCTSKAAKKMLLEHNLQLATQEINTVPGLHSALVSIPKSADTGYTTVPKKMVQLFMMTLWPSQHATFPSRNLISANTLECGD